MTPEQIRAKYGKSKTRDAINAAIRAEMVGDDDLLDALPLVHRLIVRLRERVLPGQDEAQAALDALRRLGELMADLVMRHDD